MAVLTSSFTVIKGTEIAVPAGDNYQQLLVAAALIATAALVVSLLVRKPSFTHEFAEDAVALAE